VARGVDRLAHESDAAGGAGGGLVVNHADGADGVRLVLAQLRFDCGRIGTSAPVGGEQLDLQSELAGHLLPQAGEMAGLDHQHLVARRQRVHQRGLPGARTRGRIGHDRLLGLEHVLQAFLDLQTHGAEVGAAVVHRRPVDRAQDAVGHVRRPGDLQEMTTALECHGRTPPVRGAGAVCPAQIE
jgi:hypothetical protein